MHKIKDKRRKGPEISVKKTDSIARNELRKTLPRYIMGMIFRAISYYILLMIPKYVGAILDLLLQENPSIEQVYHELYGLLFWSAFIIIPWAIARVLLYSTARRSEAKLCNRLYRSLQKVKAEYFEETPKGAYLSYLTKEISDIRKFLGGFFDNLAQVIFMPLMAIIISIGMVKPSLILASVSFIPIFILYIIWLYQKLKQIAEASRKKFVELSKKIEDNTEGFYLIKLYNNQYKEYESFRKLNAEQQKIDYKLIKNKTKMDLSIHLNTAIGTIVAVVYGIYLVNLGQLSVGSLSSFVMQIGIALSHMSQLPSMLESIIYYRIAVNRFDNLFNLDKYKNGEIKQIDANTIKVKNLSYQYKGSDELVLDNVNVLIRQGEKIGIMGPVGSGKTTLLNILTGIYEIEDGHVFFDNIDINHIHKKALKNKIGYALQDVVLFNETIRNNVSLWKEEVEEKQVKEALKDAKIYEDIIDNSRDLDTVITEKGSNLSGGQKQRITLARNLMEKKDILIIDDTLSALDAATETELLQTINQKAGDKTLIVVSNKVSTMQMLDRIYILKDGKITNVGTHEELLQKDVLYQELYQYEKESELQ